MRTIALRTLRCLLGYALAVIVSSQIAAALLIAAELTTGRTPWTGIDVGGYFLIGLIFTATLAFPPAALLIAAGELLHSRQPLFYAYAGGLTAGIAIFMLEHFTLGGDLSNPMTTACVLGGIAGGYAYASFAGVNAGRSAILPRPDATPVARLG